MPIQRKEFNKNLQYNVNLCNNLQKNPKVFEKSADNINTRNRVKDMANSFNLNTFLQEYRGYGDRKYTAVENGKAAMEQHSIDVAKEAVSSENFLSLTLTEKLAELGIGKRVVQQLYDTAIGAVKEVVNPFAEYLKKYEVVLDQQRYHDEIQVLAKQMYFSKEALTIDAASRAVGQHFVLDV